ncbi:MAG: hypothetical protein IKU33_01890 [Bacteroidales bacterium]|nr:hypothetical protein [Bacteroidales bacterium]
MNRYYMIMLLLCASLPVFSQVHGDSFVYKSVAGEIVDGRSYDLDVNGLYIGKPMTGREMMRNFGKPDEIINQQAGKYGEVGYFYGDTYLELLKGCFLEFHIYDPAFKVMSAYFDDGLNVGDHISVFEGFPDGVLQQRNPKIWGPNHYQLVADGRDCYLNVVTDDEGYVTCLYYIGYK